MLCRLVNIQGVVLSESWRIALGYWGWGLVGVGGWKYVNSDWWSELELNLWVH